MDPDAKYLTSLQAISDRTRVVGEAAQAGKLTNFNLHNEKLDDVVDFVASVIKRDYGPDKYHTIPPHGRWQHFEVGGVPRIANLLQEWKEEDGCNDTELTRRLIDLFFISVILDAGAGDDWRYREAGTGNVYERSEGIAIASLDMFNEMAFSSSKGKTNSMVDGKGLATLESATLAHGFQVTDTNPMTGIESRAALLQRLGRSFLGQPSVFGPGGRPGNLVDFVVKASNNSSELDVLTLWDALQGVLLPVWPQDRTVVGGTPVGDAWPLSTLKNSGDTSNKQFSETIQPFHKLTQWLTYSLMVPFERVLGMKWINANYLTALPEYRNGGLFVDLGALSLKPEALERGLKASGEELPLFDPADDVIVEWRAITLVLIQAVYQKLPSRMGEGVQLTMAQLLEAGTWKSGREIAAKRRPKTKSSPILIKSDGTLF